MMNFKNYAFAIAAFALVSAMAAIPVTGRAQTGPSSRSCIPDYEAIISLRPPFYGSPAIWDATFGDKDGLVQFAAAAPLENKNLLVAGEELDKNFKPVEHILVELNNRARVVSEKRYPAKTGEHSTDMIATKKGYIVSSNIQGGPRSAEKWVRLAWYDNARNYRRELVLKDGAFDYDSMGLTEAADGNGFLAVVHAISRKDPADEYGMIFRINENGQQAWKRAYRPGIPNQIYGVTAADERHYIAAGRIRSEDGRMGGWILMLNDDGTIVWQNTFPRGNYAAFRQGFTKPGDLAGDHYVLTGQAMPSGGGPGAAWVTEVDSTGNVIWQRYIRATGYDLDGRSIRAYGDGRISVMANVKAVDTTEGQQDHIRLLTLSPRGSLTDDQAYVEGNTARGTQMIQGWNGERIVTAFIERGGKIEKGGPEQFGPPEKGATTVPADAGITHHEGWVFVATALDPYTDPCAAVETNPAQ
jgi:hypothetical protein